MTSLGLTLADWARASEDLLSHSLEQPGPLTLALVFGAGLLTDREREILHLLLRGHSAKATARVLGISPETARVHRRHLYAKLDVGSQGELFSRVMTAVVGEPGPTAGR